MPEEAGLLPNGVCFSPHYKLVYLVRGGKLWVADVQGAKVASLRVFTDCMVDGVHCGPDGMRPTGGQYLGGARPRSWVIRASRYGTRPAS